MNMISVHEPCFALIETCNRTSILMSTHCTAQAAHRAMVKYVCEQITNIAANENSTDNLNEFLQEIQDTVNEGESFESNFLGESVGIEVNQAWVNDDEYPIDWTIIEINPPETINERLYTAVIENALAIMNEANNWRANVNKMPYATTNMYEYEKKLKVIFDILKYAHISVEAYRNKNDDYTHLIVNGTVYTL